jgi:Fe-S-cluster containining protein
VDEAEVAAMAAHLAMSRAEFADEFCRRVWWRTSLRERADGDCALLTPRGCAVYEARPGQCRMFPFWPDNVSSEEAWQRVKRRCPGAGRGRLYSAAEVEHIAGGEGAA